MSLTPRTVVIIPTYNEAVSLPKVLDRLLAANPQVQALVVDDASPDGTGAIADERAAADTRIEVLHRAGKSGLGTAYVAGMQRAIAAGAELVVEMDADGSHPPERLGEMLLAAERADVVLGSRWVRGGAIRDWPLRRRAISLFANAYARVLLGIPVRDITAGFRVYRADVLRRIELADVKSDGYCFQIDMVRRAVDTGARVAEVPITFTERRDGVSKMSSGVIGEAALKVAGWGIGRRGANVVSFARRVTRMRTSR